MGQRPIAAAAAVVETVERRLLLAGLDPAWNGSGRQGQPFPTASEDFDVTDARQLQVTATGKILVLAAHHTLDDFATVTWDLVRYNGDGSLDTTFGDGDGIVPVHPPPGVSIGQMLVRPVDGEILLGMSGPDSNPDDDNATTVFVQAHTPDGAVDTRFANSGFYLLPLPDPLDVDEAGLFLALAPDGDLYVANSAIHDPNNVNGPIGHATIAKLNLDGTNDAAFHGGTPLVYDLNPNNTDILNIAPQPSGQLVVACSGNALQRISAAGAVQTSVNFEEDDRFAGVSLTNFAVQSDGKLVFADEAGINEPSTILHFARLNADLTLDPSYGDNGFASKDVTIDIQTTPVPTNLLRIDDQDRAVLVLPQGEQSLATGGSALIVRVDSAGQFDPLSAAPTLRLDGIGRAASVDLQDDGKLLIGTSNGFGVARVSLVTQDIDLSAGTLTVRGTSGNDTITVATNAQMDVVLTRNGVQTTYPAEQVLSIVVDGLAGDDSITVTVDHPTTLNGRDGADTLTTEAGGDLDDDLVFGGAGNDVIDTGDGVDTIRGDAGNDSITAGDAGPELADLSHQIDGGDGNDTIHVGVGSDTLVGGAGDDRITTAAGGYDFIQGGDGNDFVSAGSSARIETDAEQAGNDTVLCADDPTSTFDIHTGDGDDSVVGGAGVEDVECGHGSDTISTAGGDDVIATQGTTEDGPNTQIDAGDGFNFIECVYAKSIAGGDGTDWITVQAAATINSGGGDDVIAVTAFAQRIDTGGGDDLVRCNSVAESPVVVLGGDGNDRIYTGSGADSIYGGSGKDTVHAGSGPDLISGGGGNDLLFGQGGKDRLYGGRGNDRLFGQGGDDRLTGGEGADQINGGDANDAADRTDPLDVLAELEADLV